MNLLLDPVQCMAGDVIFRPCSSLAFPAIPAYWMRSDAGDGAVEALQTPFASSCWISPAARWLLVFAGFEVSMLLVPRC
ncbi:hypothetical protein Nepgr_013537 [Nepenthes gracilis]|uniref:Uncharacterized protein n=1 Tax=Nepenthes gracilis TaxID=150966 RepID=A0AAD3SJY2_NEPGR|nr:hypothetical protein Nepgr_013537 [Nepenthes gracilis]